ncbi:MAG: bifunctional aspartate kinase/homoserine dehydrogenase I [Chromatiales bacterium]|nr:bifunctional aspartate kinase/homoserine dehydrogenase I [Chromatiales bacterium]
MVQNAWQVHKFGGSSLTDAQCFGQVADILLTGSSTRQAVVVSAMGGMTDALLTLVSAAEDSADAIKPGLQTIKDRYAQTLQELIGGTPAADVIMNQFQAELVDAADVLQAISLVGAAAERSRSLISGFGEIWSARLLSAFLTNKVAAKDRECNVKWVDARELIVVRHGEMGPAVQWAASQEKTARHFNAETNGIAVITGFIASDPEGLHTTLGRNGSDFSASIIATLLDADSIHIWTDVDGVMSADPNRVPEATVIPDLSYSEAMELAYFGAKVIHPQTMSPAVEKAIPIWIKNTFNPGVRGSKIGLVDNLKAGIKGVTSVDDVVLVNLEGAGMIGVPGTADRLFGALHDAGISVTLISQASSEHSICFAVPKSAATTVSQVVRQAFRNELEQNLIQNVGVQEHCSIIAVVGDGMAGLPGISAKFFGTLGAAGINVKAIAQGSSERNISAVISQADETRALRAVHSGFYLSAKTISIGLIGPGNVGGKLLDQMALQAGQLRADFGLDFRLRAIATSTRMHLSERFVDLNDWRSILDSSSEALDWDAFSAHVNAEHLPHAAILDCSASEQVAERYLGWFTHGIHVVTPNKKAHSGSLEYYHALHQQRHQHGAHFLYETTVGAALPIIETLRDLRQTGDEITSIEGIFSGTLAYLFNVFDGEVPFSQIVREARDNGYTEPDPRDDLSGMDVARKVIILAREMGMQLELEDLVIESLVPDGLDQGNVDDFLNALSEFDAAMKQRWSDAHAKGHILRYVGRLSHDDGATVQLESLPADHAFANMNLTDNIVRYVSRRYSDNPLVVQGPGAGPAVTAAGVFADLLRLASYLGARR